MLPKYAIGTMETSKIIHGDDSIELVEPLTYDKAKQLLYQGYIVKNEEFEYKAKGQDIFCREIGTIAWNTLYRIGEYEKKMQWELVGKK